jgi:hypothetical protein
MSRRPLAWLAWALWALALLGLATVVWLERLSRQAGRADLVGLGADAVPYVLAMLSAATVGAVLASRRPRHPVGWLLLALGASVVAGAVTEAYASYGLLARPGALPAARWAAVYTDGSWVAWPALVGFVLLLTPTGTLPSPGWRWWARTAAAAAALAAALRPGTLDTPFESVPNPIAVGAVPLQVAAYLAAVVNILAVPVAGVSLVARFRRARGVERQQLRWVALAAALSAMAAAVVLLGMATGTEALYGWATGVYVAVLPLAIGAAIARYRLYDLDRIISRTLAYALLTVLLGGGYAAVVLGLGQLLGRQSSLVVAGATLAVAAVFQPARRRVQDAVDRRFNRRRYDAARTIQAFSARLRDELDLGTLTGELLAVVDQTMQPTRASLWLRQPVRSSPSGPRLT